MKSKYNLLKPILSLSKFSEGKLRRVNERRKVFQWGAESSLFAGCKGTRGI